MFSDAVMQRIFENEEINIIPNKYQSMMIHAIEKVLEEEKHDTTTYDVDNAKL